MDYLNLAFASLQYIVVAENLPRNSSLNVYLLHTKILWEL